MSDFPFNFSEFFDFILTEDVYWFEKNNENMISEAKFHAQFNAVFRKNTKNLLKIIIM